MIKKGFGSPNPYILAMVFDPRKDRGIIKGAQFTLIAHAIDVPLPYQ